MPSRTRKRRSSFDQLQPDQQEEPSEQVPTPTWSKPPQAPVEAPQAVVDRIAAASDLESQLAAQPSRQRSRDRSWDQRNPPCTYRGIFESLHQEMMAIARDLSLRTRDDLYRAFLEYSLDCYQKGSLKLTPVPVGRTQMTLYPKNDEALPAKPGQGGGGKQRPKKKGGPRTLRLSFRIPGELDHQLKTIAHGSADYQKFTKPRVPIGEVINKFLEHALKDYKNGVLDLAPVPIEDLTLYDE
jgi:hypothetical protein